MSFSLIDLFFQYTPQKNYLVTRSVTQSSTMNLVCYSKH